MRELSPKSPRRRQRSLWVEALLQPTVWRRASLLGLPVGLLQAAINQGDFWWGHAVNGVVIAKTIISPLITMSVALVSAASTYVEKTLRNNSEQER
jgi:hypothetical protein